MRATEPEARAATVCGESLVGRSAVRPGLAGGYQAALEPRDDELVETRRALTRDVLTAQFTRAGEDANVVIGPGKYHDLVIRMAGLRQHGADHATGTSTSSAPKIASSGHLNTASVGAGSNAEIRARTLEQHSDTITTGRRPTPGPDNRWRVRDFGVMVNP